MSEYPLVWRWDGRVMVPLLRFEREAERRYAVNETYRMEVQEMQSAVSRGHYFVVVEEAWKNLPEHVAERWPTKDHLRKWALIRAGYYEETSIVLATKAEAIRVAAAIRPLDDYRLVTVRDAVVTIYTAKSQSLKAMGKEQFQASKDAVIGVLSELLGVEADQLTKATSA
jgi:hypothetical protein